jgi:hypothetical protein
MSPHWFDDDRITESPLSRLQAPRPLPSAPSAAPPAPPTRNRSGSTCRARPPWCSPPVQGKGPLHARAEPVRLLLLGAVMIQSLCAGPSRLPCETSRAHIGHPPSKEPAGPVQPCSAHPSPPATPCQLHPLPGSAAGSVGDGGGVVIRRKVRLALLAQVAASADNSPGKVLRPFEPHLRPRRQRDVLMLPRKKCG